MSELVDALNAALPVLPSTSQQPQSIDPEAEKEAIDGRKRGDFNAGLHRAFYGFNSAAADAIGYALDSAGYRDLSAVMKGKADHLGRMAQSNAVGHITNMGDVHGIGDAMDYAEGAIGNAAGSMAIPLSALRLAGPVAAGVTGLTQGVGEAIQEQNQDSYSTVNGTSALAGGAVSAAMDLVPELMVANRLKNIGKSAGGALPVSNGQLARDVGKEALKLGAIEGLTEMGQEGAIMASGAAAGNNNNDYSTGTVINRLLESGVQGALGGSAIGGGVGAASHVANNMAAAKEQAAKEQAAIAAKAAEDKRIAELGGLPDPFTLDNDQIKSGLEGIVQTVATAHANPDADTPNMVAPIRQYVTAANTKGVMDTKQAEDVQATLDAMDLAHNAINLSTPLQSVADATGDKTVIDAAQLLNNGAPADKLPTVGDIPTMAANISKQLESVTKQAEEVAPLAAARADALKGLQDSVAQMVNTPTDIKPAALNADPKFTTAMTDAVRANVHAVDTQLGIEPTKDEHLGSIISAFSNKPTAKLQAFVENQAKVGDDPQGAAAAQAILDTRAQYEASKRQALVNETIGSIFKTPKRLHGIAPDTKIGDILAWTPEDIQQHVESLPVSALSRKSKIVEPVGKVLSKPADVQAKMDALDVVQRNLRTATDAALAPHIEALQVKLGITANSGAPVDMITGTQVKSDVPSTQAASQTGTTAAVAPQAPATTPTSTAIDQHTGVPSDTSIQTGADMPTGNVDTTVAEGKPVSLTPTESTAPLTQASVDQGQQASVAPAAQTAIAPVAQAPVAPASQGTQTSVAPVEQAPVTQATATQAPVAPTEPTVQAQGAAKKLTKKQKAVEQQPIEPATQAPEAKKQKPEELAPIDDSTRRTIERVASVMTREAKGDSTLDKGLASDARQWAADHPEYSAHLSRAVAHMEHPVGHAAKRDKSNSFVSDNLWAEEPGTDSEQHRAVELIRHIHGNVLKLNDHVHIEFVDDPATHNTRRPEDPITNDMKAGYDTEDRVGADGTPYRVILVSRSAFTSDPVGSMTDTIVHEYGHHLMEYHLAKADPETRAAVRKEYLAYRESATTGNNARGTQAKLRKDFPRIHEADKDTAVPGGTFGRYSGPASKRTNEYLLSEPEWMAERARLWMMGNKKVVTRADKFFKELANAIRTLVSKIKSLGTKGTVSVSDSEVSKFLDRIANGAGKGRQTAPRVAAESKVDVPVDSKPSAESKVSADTKPTILADKAVETNPIAGKIADTGSRYFNPTNRSLTSNGLNTYNNSIIDAAINAFTGRKMLSATTLGRALDAMTNKVGDVVSQVIDARQIMQVWGHKFVVSKAMAEALSNHMQKISKSFTANMVKVGDNVFKNLIALREEMQRFESGLIHETQAASTRWNSFKSGVFKTGDGRELSGANLLSWIATVATNNNMHAGKPLDDLVWYKGRMVEGKLVDSGAGSKSTTHPDMTVEEVHDMLNKAYDFIGEEGRSIYQQMLTATTNTRKAVIDAYRVAISRTTDDQAVINQRVHDLEEGLFHQMEGDYFPQSRSGEYFLEARNAKGKIVYFQAYDSQLAAMQDRDHAINTGMFSKDHIVTVKRRSDVVQSIDAAGAPKFFNELRQAIDISIEDKDMRDGLQDMIRDIYIDQLASNNKMKRFASRDGIAGMTLADVIPALARSSLATARMASFVRYGPQLSDHLSVLDYFTKNRPNIDGTSDNIRERQIYTIAARNVNDDMTYRPTIGGAIVSGASRVASTWWLTSVAQFVLNLVHVPQFIAPMLTAKFTKGVLINGTVADALKNAYTATVRIMSESTKVAALGDALNHPLASVLRLDGTSADPEVAKRLLGEDWEAKVQMLQKLYQDSKLDLTFTSQVMDYARGDLEPGKVGTLFKLASLPNHVSEVVNRVVTALAAYDLAKANGLKGDAAYEAITDVMDRGHVNFSRANKSRLAHNDVGRLMTQFQSHPINVLTQVWAYVSQITDKTLPEEQRSAAQRGLAGMYMSYFAFAGALGMPLVTPVLGVVSFIMGLGDDDGEEPTDYIHSVDSTLPRFITHGFGEVFGVDVGAKVGVNSIPFYPAMAHAGATPAETAANFLFAALSGPAGATASNMFGLLTALKDGDYRTATSLAPAQIRHLVTSLNYAADGGKYDARGAMVAEVNPFAAFAQALGFTPSSVSAYGKEAAYMSNTIRTMTAARTKLINAYVKDMLAGKDTGDDRELIEAYNNTIITNGKFPRLVISGSDIHNAAKRTMKHIKAVDNYGFDVNRTFVNLRNEGQ